MSKKDIFICCFILLKPRSVEAATSPQVALFVLCSMVWEVAGVAGFITRVGPAISLVVPRAEGSLEV